MSQEPGTSQLSADQPLVDPIDDKLDRDRFSAEIARSLANWKGHGSLIVSLSGEWGSGKSTIKNFVIHHLAEKVTTIDFNPWQWSGQDKLLEGFLWQLGKTFGKEDIAKATRKLASKWRAFASITKFGHELSTIGEKLVIPFLSLSAITLWMTARLTTTPWLTWVGVCISVLFVSLSAIAGLAETVSAVLSDLGAFHEKTLEELRSEIEGEMRKLTKPIVVFADDIDRLTKEEIKLLIQLVKANAQFPNLVYFLLFQRDIVVRALAEITPDDGAKYLRKIVQVEFDVPKASDSQMQNVLTLGLDRIINTTTVKMRWNQSHWHSIFLDDLWPYFGNLRDIKRFLGSFEFYFALHVNEGVLEVNPVDLIAVEILRMFDHDAFLSISKSSLGHSAGLTSFLATEADKANAFNQEIDGVLATPARPDAYKARLKHLLQCLFPQSKNIDAANEWERDFRVCNEASFNKYFQLTIDRTKPSARDITRFVELSRDPHALVQILRIAIKNDTIEDFLSLIFVTREEIGIDAMPSVTTAMFDVGDDLPEARPSMFSTGLDMRCNSFIYHRLKAADANRRTDILWEAYKATSGFILPIYNLSLEDARARERAEKTLFLIDEGRLNDFVELTVDRIRTKAADLSLIEHKHCGVVLYRWRDWTTAEEVGTWLTGIASDPRFAIKLLRHLMSKTIINGVEEEPLFPGEAVDTLITLEILYAGIESISPEQMLPSDVVAIRLLSKAIEWKNASRPYREVRPDDLIVR